MNRKIVLVLMTIMLLQLPLLSQSVNVNGNDAMPVTIKELKSSNSRPKAPSALIMDVD